MNILWDMLIAQNRAFGLPMQSGWRDVGTPDALAAAERGELTADVTAASALSAEQRKALADTLAASLGKKITMNETVDPSLIGGLIVKVGSVMVDTSIKSKLSQLQNAMKEVG